MNRFSVVIDCKLGTSFQFSHGFQYGYRDGYLQFSEVSKHFLLKSLLNVRIYSIFFWIT